MISSKAFRCATLIGLLSLLIILPACDHDSTTPYYLNIVIWPDESAGIVSVEPEATAYTSGTAVELTAVSKRGWRFDRWEGNVTDPGVPVTGITMYQHTTITAHFVETTMGTGRPGEASAVLALDTDGVIISDALLAVPIGSNLEAPKGTQLSTEETGPLQGNAVLHLKDIHVSDIPPVSFTNWVWVFDVSVDHADGNSIVMFSSHNDSTIVDPDYIAKGLLHSAPLGDSGIHAGKEVVLYLAEQADGGNGDIPMWSPVAKTLVEEGGMSHFPVFQTGRYAIGHRVYVNPHPPNPGSKKLFDCVIEFDRVIEALLVIEKSNAAVFGAWSFLEIPEDQMPETTEWFAQGGDEPSWGRLENHGHRFRVRSRYANAFFVSSVSLRPDAREDPQERLGMSGPYEVKANGQTAANPIIDPYDQCDLDFATQVKIKLIARNGTWASFKTDVLNPLRAIYDDPNLLASNVKRQVFKKLYEGYYAEVWVRTPGCARKVYNNIPMVHEEGVIVIKFDGRAFYVADLRGIGPYLAVHTLIADKTLGLRFYDPFWAIQGGVLEKHVLGGPNNMLPVVRDMRYDPVSDTLWVVYFDLDKVPHVQRFDKPVFNFGDRPSDFSIHLGDEEFLKNFIFDQMYLDPAHDRLFLVYKILGEGGYRINIYANASTTPVLENQINNMVSMNPHESEIGPLYLDYIAPIGDIVYIYHGYNDVLQLYTYNLASQNDKCARFKALATFGGAHSAPILKGVYSRVNDVLYAGTSLEINGLSSIYAIEHPSSWKSEYIIQHENVGYWEPDFPRYRTLTWGNAGKILDISIIEGNPELMAVCHTPAGWGMSTSQILLFDSVNTAVDHLTPFYFLNFPSRRILSIVLINPPKPEEKE